MPTRPLLYVFTCMLLLCAVYTGAWAEDDTEEELLDPKVAFVPSGFAVSEDIIAVKYEIAEGYYLYKHSFKFAAPDGNIELSEPVIPPGKKKVDDWFGEVETYRHQIVIKLPYTWPQQKPDFVVLQVTSQGCADIGVCFPPQKQFIEVNTTKLVKVEVSDLPVSEQDRLAARLAQGASILTLLTFYGLGILLAFTPCVLPMIPILSGIIVGRGESITTGKAFILSLVYVLAMAVTYTIAGIIVGSSGENIQIWFQNPWVLGIFAAIFVLLSLSMFGFYELQIPSAIQSRLSAISNKQESGTFIGAVIMGFLSALIVGPCVTAPLIGSLIYIADTGDAILGGAALFSLSLGMGTPLIIIGTSAGKLLPKAGGWMDAVKAFFGVVLIAVAIWLISRVTPEMVTMLLYAVLLIGSAIYMGALEPRKESSSQWSPLWKAIGLILLLYGVLLIVGTGIGGGTMMQPLRGLQGSTNGTGAATEHALEFEQIKGLKGLEQALTEAQESNQPIMLDFYADWCTSCKEMEAYTFTDKDIQATLTAFKLIQTDVTKDDDEDKALRDKLGVPAPPSIVFFDRKGSEIQGSRIVGYMNAEDFNTRLQQILNNI